MNSANKNSHSCVRQLHNSKLHKIIMLNLDFATLFLCITWPNFFKTHFYQKSISDRQNDRHCDKIESPLCCMKSLYSYPFIQIWQITHFIFSFRSFFKSLYFDNIPNKALIIYYDIYQMLTKMYWPLTAMALVI